MGVLPGKFVAAADVEEFEGAASAGAGGHVSRGAKSQRQTMPDRAIGKCGSDAWDVDKGARTCGQAWRGL